jgi:hypothetical protein
VFWSSSTALLVYDTKFPITLKGVASINLCSRLSLKLTVGGSYDADGPKRGDNRQIDASIPRNFLGGGF